MRLAWLVIALLVLGSGDASARLRVGTSATAQWASLTEPPVMRLPFDSGEPAREWTAAPAVGAVLAWDLAPNLSIEASPQLVDQPDRVDYGSYFFSGGLDYRVRTNARLTSIALPGRAVWSPLPGLRLMAGPEFRYLVRATQTLQAAPTIPAAGPGGASPAQAEAIIFEDYPLTFDTIEAFHRWGFGASAGAGMAWGVAEHDARLDVVWSQGLTNLTRLEEDGRKWQGLQLSLSVLW